jgi:hypothetical protein
MVGGREIATASCFRYGRERPVGLPRVVLIGQRIRRRTVAVGRRVQRQFKCIAVRTRGELVRVIRVLVLVGGQALVGADSVIWRDDVTDARHFLFSDFKYQLKASNSRARTRHWRRD